MCMDREQETFAQRSIDERQAGVFRRLEGPLSELRNLTRLVEIAGDSVLGLDDGCEALAVYRSDRDALIAGFTLLRRTAEQLLDAYHAGYRGEGAL